MNLKLIDAIILPRPETQGSTADTPSCGSAPDAFAGGERNILRQSQEENAAALRERIKELNCLVKLSRLADKHDSSQSDMLQAAAEIIPSGWQYSEIACARIVLEHEEFKTSNFIETLWKQSSGIFANGSLIGGLEVCYLENKPAADEGPFLKEERTLINAVATDIGKLIELKRAYAELRREEEKYRGLFEANNDAIFIVESETLRIADCNRQAERMTGCPREKLLSTDAGTILCGPSESLALEDFARRIIESEEASECEIAVRGGTAVPVSIFSTAFEFGGKFCHQLILRDISAHKETERVLRKAKETAELTAQMKSEFVSNVSHELRTPMNAIIGFAGMLFDTNLSKEQREFVEIIKSSGDTLIALIDEILDFSKIEGSRMEIECVPFEPALVIDEICELIRPEIARKQIELKRDIGGEVPRSVRGDPARFGQVLVNLLENAAKFTESGEIEIAAGADEGPGDEITLRVSVRDTGIGIAEDKLPIIFAPFQQADGSNTREHGGTGLGLTICRQIAALLGGEIRVESEPGKGSTFYFTSRVRKSAETEAS
jgi:PAS domain S-box-containing protein